MPISIEKLREAARRVGADLMHSDNDLDKKLEPATPEYSGPEAGPSNDELIDNSHPADGAKGAPVLDGDIRPPERQNVTAIKDAIEAQSEMEIGKPIEQKQEEVKIEEAAAQAAIGQAPNAIKVDAQPGKQIIINIAKEVDRAISVQPTHAQPIGGETQNPREKATSGTSNGMFGGTNLSATPNMEKKSEVTPHRPLYCYIVDEMGDTEEGGHVNTTAEAAQWFKDRGINIYSEVKAEDNGKDTTFTFQRGKTAGAFEDYKKKRMERDQIISQNRSRQMKGEPRLPVPPKPEVPKVPVAYAADGTYEGRLQHPDDCPPGCTVRWEPMKGAHSYHELKQAFLSKKARFLTIDECRTAGRESLVVLTL